MLNISFNTAEVLRRLTDVQQRQIPFALQLAFNRTAEERQVRMQDRINTQLNFRNASAKTQARRIVRFGREDRADKKRQPITATLRIIGGDVAATAPILQRLSSMVLRGEEGGSHTSQALYRHGKTFITGGFIMPAPGQRTATKAMPLKLYPKSIGLDPRRAIAGGDEFASSYKGGRKKKGTGFKKHTRYYFVKPGVGIFVRTQVGKESEYDAVWFFRQRITIPRRLQLEEKFEHGLAQQVETNFIGFLDFALRTAK